MDPRVGLLVRGCAAIVFGIVVLAAPTQALALFVPLFATFVLVDGGAALAGAEPRWWALSLVGAVGLAACLFCFVIPSEGPVAVVTAFGAWSFAIGLLEVLTSAQMRRVYEDEYFLTLSGLLSFAVGLVAIAARVESAAALMPWVAASLVIGGLFRTVLAVRAISLPANPGTSPVATL